MGPGEVAAPRTHLLAHPFPERRQTQLTSAGPRHTGGGRPPLVPRLHPGVGVRDHGTKPSSRDPCPVSDGVARLQRRVENDGGLFALDEFPKEPRTHSVVRRRRMQSTSHLLKTVLDKWRRNESAPGVLPDRESGLTTPRRSTTDIQERSKDYTRRLACLSQTHRPKRPATTKFSRCRECGYDRTLLVSCTIW